MGVTLYSRLPQIAAQMPAKAGAVVQKTVMDVEAGARSAAPVDTGALQNSIQGRMTGQLDGEVTTGLEYSMYVEYGTYKMAAQPYLVPAAEQARGPFIAAMKQIVS